MKLHDGTIVSRAEVSPHKFGGDPMAEYLHYLAGSSGQDCETGSATEWHYWVAQFGKRLLFEDSQGFVWVDNYGSIAGAEDAFNEIARDYETWEEEG
jgi:hypothetical protein